MKCKKTSVIKNPNGDDHTWKCEEDALNDSDYCILHTKYPEFGSSEYDEIDKLKMEKIKEKLKNKDFSYIAAILDKIGFRDMEINQIELMNAKIGSFHLKNINIVGHTINFGDGSKFENFNDIINCEKAIIGDTYFENVNIGTSALFNNVKTSQLIFNHVNIGLYAGFDNIKIKNYIQFMDVEVNGDISFNNAKLCDRVNLDFSKIKGAMHLKDAQFKRSINQEKVFRLAKNTWENLGDRVEADHCFYKEMEAKRKQKRWYFRYPEVAIQYCFGYGVYPGRFVVTWLSVILIFAVIYLTQTWNYSDFLSYFYSSVVTAITPGFGTYRPEGVYQLVASIEAIIGTFMWAALIATFTRKYMR